jgi:hypothetical protein
MANAALRLDKCGGIAYLLHRAVSLGYTFQPAARLPTFQPMNAPLLRGCPS